MSVLETRGLVGGIGLYFINLSALPNLSRFSLNYGTGSDGTARKWCKVERGAAFNSGYIPGVSNRKAAINKNK